MASLRLTASYVNNSNQVTQTVSIDIPQATAAKALERMKLYDPNNPPATAAELRNFLRKMLRMLLKKWVQQREAEQLSDDYGASVQGNREAYIAQNSGVVDESSLDEE